MSPIFQNLGKIPEETAHVLQNLVSAKGLTACMSVTYYKTMLRTAYVLDALCLVAILINDVSLTYSNPILTQIRIIRFGVHVFEHNRPYYGKRRSC